MMLREGGSIVSSESCSADEVILANARGRVFHDKDGFGYVYRPRTKEPKP